MLNEKLLLPPGESNDRAVIYEGFHNAPISVLSRYYLTLGQLAARSYFWIPDPTCLRDAFQLNACSMSAMNLYVDRRAWWLLLHSAENRGWAK